MHLDIDLLMSCVCTILEMSNRTTKCVFDSECSVGGNSVTSKTERSIDRQSTSLGKIEFLVGVLDRSVGGETKSTLRNTARTTVRHRHYLQLEIHECSSNGSRYKTKREKGVDIRRLLHCGYISFVRNDRLRRSDKDVSSAHL